MALRKASRPDLSISSKVSPSVPGAPPFLFACRYASVRTSIFAMCTKIPQKRCFRSDFAFRYIRRRSSCKSMGAFIISPLPHLARRNVYRSGLFPLRVFCCTQVKGVGSEEAPRRLTSVRRSNCAYGFPVHSFHKDSLSARCNRRYQCNQIYKTYFTIQSGSR